MGSAPRDSQRIVACVYGQGLKGKQPQIGEKSGVHTREGEGEGEGEGGEGEGGEGEREGGEGKWEGERDLINIVFRGGEACVDHECSDSIPV